MFAIASFILIIQILEVMYVRNYKRPFLVFYTIFNQKLEDNQRKLLAQNNQFYSKLKPRYKKYFENRVVKFIEKYPFHGNDIEITDEMKVLIAGVYVKLTFGFRNYLPQAFSKILIYPDIYYSTNSETYHKGEFNPKLKIVVFSWKHFIEGIEISNDNLNLGLHEFTHVVHIESQIKTDLKSIIFKENLNSLFEILKNKKMQRDLIESGFLREYAFENQYEFVAVLLEHFFESPQNFKTQFPQIYQKVKQMINYNESRFNLS